MREGTLTGAFGELLFKMSSSRSRKSQEDIQAILAASDAGASSDASSYSSSAPGSGRSHPARRKTVVVQAQRRQEAGTSASAGLQLRSGTRQKCAVFQRTGKCPFGAKCPYEHALESKEENSSSPTKRGTARTSPKVGKPKRSADSSSSSAGTRRSPRVHAEHSALSAAELNAQASAMADMNRQYELSLLNNALDNTLSRVSNMLLQDEGGGTSREQQLSVTPARGGGRGSSALGPIAEGSRSSFSFAGASPSPVVPRRAEDHSDILDQSFQFSSSGNGPRAETTPTSSRRLTPSPARSNSKHKGADRRSRDQRGESPRASPHRPTLIAGLTPQEILAMVVKNQRSSLQRVFGWTQGCLNPDDGHLWSQNDTALHYCACYNSDLVAEMLLELSANPNTRNVQQQTPVHFAAQYDSAAVLDKLLVAKAQVESRNLIDQTPMHYASRYGSVTALALLLDAKGDPFVLNGSKQTPMHYAFKHNRAHIASLLLDAGGSEAMDKINSKHQSPVELGRASRSHEVLAMYEDFLRTGFLPVTVEAALMRFRRSQDGLGDGSNEDASRAQHEEIVKLKRELEAAQGDKAKQAKHIGELEDRIADLQAEAARLRAQQADDELDLHFDGWQCFMCCLPKDLKVIPRGQLRTVRIARKK